MDLGIFTIPALVLMGLFGFSIVTGSQEVMFGQFDVPASVAEKGYSASVVTQGVADAYRDLNKNARTARQLRDFGLRSDQTVVGALGDYFNIGSVVSAARHDLGLIEFDIGGDVIDQGEIWVFRVRVARSGGTAETVIIRGPSETPEALILQAAVAAMRLTDPYVLASYYYEAQMDAGTTDFAATRRVLEHAIATLPTDDYDWLYNLWGLTLLMEGKPEAAILEFRRVLALNPGFVFAVHNWGMALADQGQYRAAIGKFRRVLEIDGEQLSGARTYAEWAAAAAALGRREEAAALIQRSLAIDPRGDRAYFRWGQLLEEAGRYREAREKYRLALLFNPPRTRYRVDIDRVTGLLETGKI